MTAYKHYTNKRHQDTLAIYYCRPLGRKKKRGIL